MLETYTAILRNNHIEWCGKAPENLSPNQEIRVCVTLLDNSNDKAGKGPHMAEALEKIAALAQLDGLTNPAAWERETRQDRSLPGRDS